VFFPYSDSLADAHDDWEEFDICKDAGGRTVLIAASPYDQSGDSYAEYESYFDSTGRVFAYERYRGAVWCPCTTSGYGETIIKFFDPSFRVIDSTYLLQNGKGKKLKDKNCIEQDKEFPYSNYPTVKEFYRSEKIKEKP